MASATSNRTQIVDVTYDDPRTGERIRERRIQEVPPDGMEDTRNRELALFEEHRPLSRGADRSCERGDNRDNRDNAGENEAQYYRYQRTVQRGVRGMDVGRSRSYDRPFPRRTHSRGWYENDEFDRDPSQERRRHRRRRSHRSSDRRPASEDDGYERMWHDMKRRREGNVVERNFDSSYDGIIAGVAGAAIGAMTARHFAKGEENRTWKVLGGAVAGAAATNVAENYYRLYTEEKHENGRRRDRS
ncbi:hypothetical protein Q7P37_005303 [Cladosporium fusiforme]